MFTDTIVKKYVVDQFVEEDALVAECGNQEGLSHSEGNAARRDTGGERV